MYAGQHQLVVPKVPQHAEEALALFSGLGFRVALLSNDSLESFSMLVTQRIILINRLTL